MFQNYRQCIIFLPAAFIYLLISFGIPCYSDVTETHTFKRVFHKGAITRYKVTRITESDDSGRSEDEFIVTETVKELKPDGAAIVTSHIQVLKINGHEILEKEKTSANLMIQFDKSGAFQDKKLYADLDVVANSNYMPGVSYPIFGFPDQPLKVGDAWKIEIAGDAGGRGKHSIRFKSMGIVKVKIGVLTEALHAKVDDSMTLGGGRGTLDEEWNIYLDPKTGTLLKMTMETNNFPDVIHSSFYTIKLSRVLLPPDTSRRIDSIK